MVEAKKSRPRRGFFRGSGDKKSAKKQQKLQQKHDQQQQQQVLRQEQQQQQLKQKKRLSTSQSQSSSTPTDSHSEPPLGLGGPRQTAPTHPHSYGQRVREIEYQPFPPATSHHQHEQQFGHHQYPPQPHLSVPNQHTHQQPQHELQYGALSSASHPQHDANVLPQEQTHQPSSNLALSLNEATSLHNVLPQSITPTVDDATAEIWKCQVDDFQSASHAIQMLRLAIVAEWESQQMTESGGSFPGTHRFSYDPAKSFSRLQEATLRFHARFEALRAEREAEMLRVDNEDAAHHPLSSLNGVEWELAEEAAWEVWEEAVRASAALTHACVGPSWRRQLKVRRELLRESEMRLFHLQHQGRFDVDNISIESMTSTIASMDTSVPHSSGRFIPEQGSVMTPVWQPPRDVLEMLSFDIPEVLPAAIIGFAVSVNQLLPPVRSANTKIYWDMEKSGNSSGTKEALLTPLGQHLLDERRWLRRRKQLSDTQRDLVYGLFCAGRTVEEAGEAAGDADWSIPGAHTPVAEMIHSWLEACQAGTLFILKKTEEGDIPFHVEEISNESPNHVASPDSGNALPPSSEQSLVCDGPQPPAELSFSGTKDATEPLRRKFSFWGDVVGSEGVDWMYTLRVLRDCSDLVSTGWRPPPSGPVGEGILLILISIAEKGMSHLSENGDKEMPGQQIHKERLVACSCASESLVAMKNLATRDVTPSAIPMATLQPLTITLCKVISSAEVTTSFGSSSGVVPEEARADDASLEKEVFAQRMMVTSNAAELLWLLLSNEETSCPTTDALLDVIDMDLRDADNLMHAQEHAIIASGAIRALSAAMWGDPPTVKGVSSLRFIWEPVVNLFGAVASSFFNDRGSETTAVAELETPVIKVDGQGYGGRYNNSPYMNVILEIVLALSRFVDSEMVHGTGDLCATEWESFVKTIDVGISPWLAYHQISSPLAPDIRVETVAIFSKLITFLEKCSQVDSGFHQIVDADARNFLHTFLLRKISPLIGRSELGGSATTPTLPSEDRGTREVAAMRSARPLIGTKTLATRLALSVIKSMNVSRFLSFKKGDWATRASDLLAEAFATPNSQTMDGHQYIGGYLHHPIVRLEALRSLVEDDLSEASSIKDSDSISSSGLSTVTPVSIKSGNVPPKLSLFSLTCNQRELHLELVNCIILPRLEEILSTTEPILEKTEYKEVQTDVVEYEFSLLRFSVQTLGRLFRSRTGEGEKRHHFISLLQSVATSTPYGIQEWFHQREKEDIKLKFPDKGSILASEFLRVEEMRLRLEAIHQIELCLGAPFCCEELPHSHGNVPDLTKALSLTACFYSTETIEGAKQTMGQADRLLLTLASILPLARLSCARSGQGILRSRHSALDGIPHDILSAISVDDWNHKISRTLSIVSEENVTFDHGHIAPFVFVKRKGDSHLSQESTKQQRRRQTRRSSSNPIMDGKQGTVVDFEPIAAAIKHVLNAAPCDLLPAHGENKTISQTSITQLPSIVRTICYTSISCFFSHGMAFPQMDDLLWLDLDSSFGKKGDEELLSRSKALSDYAGVLGHMIVSHIGDAEDNLQLCRKVCIVLVQSSMTTPKTSCEDCTFTKVVQHACCGLISILSSLDHSFKKRSKGSKSSSNTTTKYDKAISSCLISFIDHVCSVLQKEKGEPTSDSVLIPLIDAMREAISCADRFFDFPRPLRRQTFLILFQLSHDQWEVQIVAFQCAIALINSMTTKEASLMMFFTVGCEKCARLRNQKRIQPLLIDFLRYRLISARLLEMSAGTKLSCRQSPLAHRRLAQDIGSSMKSLETFPVDLDDFGCPKFSAWKCGNTILTLRIGSKDSLHRGWVEVVVRSPCSHIRRLIKWKEECTTEHPDSFDSFGRQMRPKPSVSREATPPCTRSDEQIDKVRASPVQSNTVKTESAQFLESDQSLKILANAKNVINRFDSLAENNENHNISLTKRRTFNSNGREKSKDDGKEYVTCSSLKRTLSDGDLGKSSQSNRSETLHERNNASSVYSWLKHATGSQLTDVDITQELLALGFSQSMLGIPKSVITTSSYQDLFVHEQLKPFKIGPNLNRAISILDRVTPFQTHRIALFYGGTFGRPNKRNSCGAKADSSNTKNDGDKFLMSTQGSTDFWQFAEELGDLVPVRHCNFFSAGLDTSESLSDGSWALVSFDCQSGSYDSNDPILVDSMTFFHAVTLMPDKVTNRKRHVGNDVVHIVYGLDIDTLDVDHERMAISGHFGFITIYVVPLVHVPLYKISCCLKSSLDKCVCSALSHLVGNWLISRQVGAHFVRNLARQADVICQSMIEDKLGLVLNTEDRVRRIRETKRHLQNAGFHS